MANGGKFSCWEFDVLMTASMKVQFEEPLTYEEAKVAFLNNEYYDIGDIRDEKVYDVRDGEGY